MSTPAACIPELTDQSPMPFGKYAGQTLESVPARYLLWLWDDGFYRKPGHSLHRYIWDAFPALEKDAPDYIVKHPREVGGRK